MKFIITLLLLTYSCFSYANDEANDPCNQVKDEKIYACQVSFDRCNAHNPDSEICISILDACTTKAYIEYSECLEN